MRNVPVPASSRELYDVLVQTPDLCGTLTIENEVCLRWDLWEGYHLSISIDKGHGHISLGKNGFFSQSVTHWHPEPEEMYEELCDIGVRGNVLVIRKWLLGEGVVYMGPEKDCPRRAGKKGLLSKLLYLKAQ